MTRIKHPFRSSASFRSLLLAIVSLGIVGLALTASITTAWLTSKQAAKQMVAQGLKVTETLAHQGVLALLFESPANAKDPLEAIISFPNILNASLFDLEIKPLLTLGDSIKKPSLLIGEHDDGCAVLIGEDKKCWIFSAAVVTGRRDSSDTGVDNLFQLSTSDQEKIGYAYVVMDKSALNKMTMNVFVNNIAIGLSFALILLFFINIGIKRLTRPLYQLADLMEVAEHENQHVFANLKGPKEINYMAGIFNRMMASLEERDKRLRQHRKLLQTEVDIRTKELVLARDAAMSASRHKSEFLANMSHELRTPLQAIIGYSDVVKEELELEGMDENAGELERVIGNAQRLLGLINHILDLSKIEAGKMELRLQDTSLKEIMDEAIATIRPLLKQNNNQISSEIHDELGKLHIDKEKLLQMVLNLLSNASKFTKKGLISVEATRETHLLVIRVVDTGIGLTTKQQAVIFEEFRQVDGSTTRNFEGTGLGLTITKRFAQLMGGNISVKSIHGQGATFTINLPLPIADSAAVRVKEVDSMQHNTPVISRNTSFVPYSAQNRCSVLLIDDDSSFLELQVRALEEAGYNVFSATSGDEALHRAKALQPDIITLDIMMPNMDGWEVLQRLREDPQLATIPVIVCSIVDDKDYGFELGANEYVTKPIQRAKLLLTIDKVCKELQK